MKKQDIKNLKFRYLLWLYKTTKEELDRIERKFTQLEIDKELREQLLEKISQLKIEDKSKLHKLLEEFDDYIYRKQRDGRALKYDKLDIKANYQFLELKLEALEERIVKELGKRARDEIRTLYEEEMKRRILESKEEHN